MEPAAERQYPALAVALDVPDEQAALALATALRGQVTWLKVGLRLFVAHGPVLVDRLRNMGFKIFLDLKLHDIPNTVRQAVQSAAGTGAHLLTVHALGGPAMLAAAAEGARGTDLELAAVTVLTSHSEEETRSLYGKDPRTLSEELARTACAAGLGWVVCSAHEAGGIKKTTAEALRVITPGIRLADTKGDQARVASPSFAVGQGADLLVVGRPIHGAHNPAQAAKRYMRDMQGDKGDV